MHRYRSRMLLSSVIFMSLCSLSIGVQSPKIAIIGGGIGGSSCAHFLKKYFPPNISITLFEHNEIGGRLSTIEVNGQTYESGGAIIHPLNKYLVDFARLLGLEHRKSTEGLFSIYNGRKFLFQENTWSFATFVSLLWRYGFDVFRLQHYINSLMNDFNRIYAVQEEGYSYTTVSGLLKQMRPSMFNLTQETLLSYMKKEGFSENFINEVVQAITLVNYGQDVNMSAFAGTVAIAGADPELWSVKGGNKMVPAKLLERSAVKVIHGEVAEVRLEDFGTFTVSWKGTSLDVITKADIFEIVILSAPLTRNKPNIRFRNFPTDFSEYEKSFHRTVATFVSGKLNSSAFQVHQVTDDILTNNNTLFFNSIGIVYPVSGIDYGKKRVYKVFSRNPLTEEQIRSLFGNVDEIQVKDWMAYPHYSAPETIPPFALYSGLYYTNAIEWAASAMEMSAIGGRNVALLAYNYWNNRIHLIDNSEKLSRDEL